MIWLVSAFSLGLLGSFHCIGMCGPIAIALPVHHLVPLKKFIAIVLYNLGRAITYACLGLIFGLLGQSIYMAGFQQFLSVGLGLVLLFSILLPSLWKKVFPGTGFLNGTVNRIKLKLRNLFTFQSLPVLFLIGILNGLLPCGLVYIGIAGAIVTGNYLEGAAFMFFFGLGTFPVMASVSTFGQFIAVKYRNIVRKSIPMVIVAMSVLLVLRGLNLGIPYLSPAVSINEDAGNSSKFFQQGGNKKQVIKCCPKPKEELNNIKTNKSD